MEPIDVYLMYCAMKAHFSRKDYDFLTYKGKSRVPRDSFFKRKDRVFFVKLSKKYSEEDLKNYFVANFIIEKQGYIANFNDENYEQWKEKRNNFYDIFTEMCFHSTIHQINVNWFHYFSDGGLNIFVSILILNDLLSPSALKGYTPCLRLAGNKYQLPTLGVNPILSFSKDRLSLEPVLFRTSKTPFDLLPCGVFLRSPDKSGTFKNPTQVSSQSVCV